MNNRITDIIKTIAIGVVVAIIAFLVFLVAYSFVNEADAYSQCADYEDEPSGCWCINEDDEPIQVSPSYCDESFGREELLISAGWIASIAIIYHLSSEDSGLLGIIEDRIDRRWELKSNGDRMMVEFAIPF